MKIMKSFVGKPRTAYPWLKGRPNLGDCAAGYARVATGNTNKIIWVSELVKLMKKNGTWKKGSPKMGDAVIYDWNGDGGCDHVAMFHSKTKNGLWVAFGANQGKDNVVTKLLTGKGPILGWGTPFEFEAPEPAVTEVIGSDGPETDVSAMPLRPEHYEAPESPVSPVEAPTPVENVIVPPKAFQPLSRGSKGFNVKKLQNALKVTADGDFGPITEKAVKAYQLKKGIVITGVVDESTWKRLKL
jgi:hypothetical protein